jgi:hypothetical protein
MGVRYVLQSERMGHEVPGMRGVYSHITPAMREEIRSGLQKVWESALYERALLSPRSAVAVVDAVLAPIRGAAKHDRLPNPPRIGQLHAGGSAEVTVRSLTCTDIGVDDGT